MKVADYEKSKTTKEMDPEIEQCLSPVERKLARFLHRIEIRGKFGRKVAILLTPTMLEDVERVITQRVEHSIESPYLFASMSGERPIRGCDVIQRFAKEAQVREPSVFTWTAMRKQLATITQAMGLAW